MRVNVQLVETDGGRQIWAEQYDCELGRIFDVQDEIVATITAQLEPEIGREEFSRTGRRSPQAFGAWDHFRLGTHQFYLATAEGNREAERLFRRAIEVDPSLAEAHGFLAYAIVLSMIYFDAAPDESRLTEAVEFARRGVALDERDAMVRFMYGRTLLARHDYAAALDEMQTALALNPNLAVVHCGLGDSLAYGGHSAEAMPHFERALALSPHDPMRWAFWSYGALAHLFARNFVAAEVWALRATRIPNCHYWGYAHRVSALGHLSGRSDDERATARADLERQCPGFNCRMARLRLFYLKDPAQIDVYVDGLRRAGVASD